MIDRVKEILKEFGLSPSGFADRIEVQRPNVSHVLSGRNKPSLDFAIRILQSFPEISADWLLNGNGVMFKNKEEKMPVRDLAEENVARQKPVSPSAPVKRQNQNKDGVLKKIILIYEDGSFEELLPR